MDRQNDMNVSRRKLMVGSAALAGGSALAIGRPADRSGPREPYFLGLQRALRHAGIAQPTLVVDLDRLHSNIDQLMSDIPDGMGYRIVAKSLPSLDLLAEVRRRSGTDRLMTFNLPMLLALSQSMADASQLLGKPFPAQALRNYLDELSVEHADAAANVQWLVDTPERLDQYSEIARASGASLRVNIEIDVGLHRGGVLPGDRLLAMLATIQKSTELSFAGFMGYEPHLSKIPTALGWRDRSKQNSWSIYQSALKQAASVFDQSTVDNITRNAAGSPTYRLYKDTSIANEISVGSALVKPIDFDTDLLTSFVPAAFIAAPVIKSIAKTQIPGLEFADGIRRSWNRNLDKTVFIHGGRWMAYPEDPPGLSYNSTFGRSSNQEMLNGGSNTEIATDDFVFLRPTQSEAVFTQFGDIAVYRGGNIVDSWPVFPSSG